MHIKSYITSLLLSVCLMSSNILAATLDNQATRIEPITTTALASLLAPAITNVITGLFGSLFKPNDYHDTVIYGRSMRIKMCGDTCVQITDRASGITVVGTGTSAQVAIGDATQKMFHELLDKSLLSLHDLCLLGIKFPHPDQQNCPGQQINTCDLVTVINTTKPNCINKLGDAYCQKNGNRCFDHLYQVFMMDNCYKQCTNGCQTTGPVDPCKVGL